MKEIYLVECGVLLSKEHDEYKFYCGVYDKKHGFYDETQFITTNKDFAINEINNYVKNGVANTYGIITTQFVEDDELYNELLEEEEYNPYLDIFDWGFQLYDMESVVYSIYKNKEKIIVENFLESEN